EARLLSGGLGREHGRRQNVVASECALPRTSGLARGNTRSVRAALVCRAVLDDRPGSIDDRMKIGVAPPVFAPGVSYECAAVSTRVVRVAVETTPLARAGVENARRGEDQRRSAKDAAQIHDALS